MHTNPPHVTLVLHRIGNYSIEVTQKDPGNNTYALHHHHLGIDQLDMIVFLGRVKGLHFTSFHPYKSPILLKRVKLVTREFYCSPFRSQNTSLYSLQTNKHVRSKEGGWVG